MAESDAADKAREEFFSEAQEIVEALSRDLLWLDDVQKRGASDPERINDVFRAVHTLKGLSGLFGVSLMSGLSHELEDVLDHLRMGRVVLSREIMDLLFRSVEMYGRILAADKADASEPAGEVKDLIALLGHVMAPREVVGATNTARYEIDPGLMGVLTEYEEHRLRSNIQAGVLLFRVHVEFSHATIDSALDELRARVKPLGEIITTLPADSSAEDTIGLEILVASRKSIDNVRQALAAPNVVVDEMPRKDGVSEFPSLPPPGAHVPYIDPALTAHDAPRLIADKAPPAHTPLGPAPSAMVARGAPPRQELSLRSVSQTVRVDIRKLDRLMNIVGELAILRGGILRLGEQTRGQPGMRALSVDLQRLHRSFERQLLQMQNGILEVRMVPLGQVFDKLARIVRQISREHDKEVNLVISGADTEIDKLMVEELSDPLMHMMRNAIDHGIEPRDERMGMGKPRVGTIALNAFQKGNHVVIEIEDDGRGMAAVALVQAAIRHGILTPEEAKDISPRQALDLVFLPGFTTRSDVTALSGRGLGMDIVKTKIAKLGGIVDVASEQSVGTKMTITLPITLAIIRVLIVEVVGRTYCVPLASIEEAIALDPEAVRTVEGREIMTQRGATLPICRLSKLFGHQERAQVHGAGKQFIVIASVGERRMGLVVDRLVGQRDIIIKPLGRSLAKVRGFAGATELGDQRVGLVIDAASIMQEVLSTSVEGRVPAYAVVR